MNQIFLDSTCTAIMLIFSLSIIAIASGFFETIGALLVGDRTAYEEGFLSVNPAVYINPVGLLLLGSCVVFAYMLSPQQPYIYYFLFVLLLGPQWRYDVPSDPTQYSSMTVGLPIVIFFNMLGCLLVALGGLYGIHYLPLMHLGVWLPLATQFLVTLVTFSLWTVVLAIIPLPPFRSWELIATFAPLRWYRGIEYIEQYSIVVPLVLFFIPGISEWFLYGLSTMMQWLLMGLQVLVF